MIEVRHGDFSFTVVPTRGMGIWRAVLGDLPLGWKSPVQGPVHPATSHWSGRTGLGWLDGFDELLVRCGLESNGAGVPAGWRLRYGCTARSPTFPRIRSKWRSMVKRADRRPRHS